MAPLKTYINSSLLITMTLIAMAMASTTAAKTTTKNHDHPSSCSKKHIHSSSWIIARDAITLSMKEIRDTMNYIKTIPKLEGVQAKATVELYQCINGMVDNLANVRSALGNLRRDISHGGNQGEDAENVKRMVSAVMEYENMCKQPLQDVDQTVVLMLKRKIVDVSLVVQDVVLRVVEFESQIGGGGGGESPSPTTKKH